MRLGLRVFLGYFLIVALAALVVQQVFVKEVKPAVRQAMEETLVDTANILAELAAPDMKNGNIATGEFAAQIKGYGRRDIDARIWGLRKSSLDYRVYVTDATGIVVFDSTGQALGKDYSRWNDVYQTLHGRYGARSSRDVESDENSSAMHVAAPIKSGTALLGVLSVSKPYSSLQPAINKSERIILRWSLGMIAASLLLGALMTWWVSKTLGALQHYARSVSAGERATPPQRGPAEIVELGSQLEHMRQQLEGKQYVEQTMHSLTHEMKSPLAAIQGASELLSDAYSEEVPADVRQRFMNNIKEQSSRLSQMVEKMLALAALEHRQALENPQPMSLSSLLREMRALTEPQASQLGITLEFRLPEQAEGEDTDVVDGDPFLIKQALSNLLENALSFSPAGSSVEVSLARAGKMAEIRVRDHGAGIPDFALARLFERFFSLPRPDGNAKSTGLGLCFVKEIAQLHRGSITLANAKDGGALAILTLPFAHPTT
jgi:two-component system sensor histidine kinase CreC